uniref:Uncharacterized protein n=1 Tax=Amphimedon queenslandica TaxID=400682 RepID=A0A1X7SYR2_AMPQE
QSEVCIIKPICPIDFLEPKQFKSACTYTKY